MDDSYPGGALTEGGKLSLRKPVEIFCDFPTTQQRMMKLKCFEHYLKSVGRGMGGAGRD